MKTAEMQVKTHIQGPELAVRSSAKNVGIGVERSVPSYRRHRQSGQAIVTLTDGLGSRRDVLLGKYGTRESRQEYARVVGEWEGAGRRLPGPAPDDLTVAEVILSYWTFAEGYYRKNGKPTEQQHRIRQVLRVVREMYGHCPAVEFGPKSLKAIRDRRSRLPCGLCKGTGLLEASASSKKAKRTWELSGMTKPAEVRNTNVPLACQET